MGKHEKLDEMILSSIGDKEKSFSDIYFASERGSPNIYEECKSMVIGRQEPARILDRRLQALRKKGLICFAGGWRKVQQK